MRESGKRSDKMSLQSEIFRMECMVLDGAPVRQEDLMLLPASEMEASPLLLKAYGEIMLKQGRLCDARNTWLKSMQGFAKQTFQPLFLDVMALLARVDMKMGNYSDARTMLLFLKEEYARKTEPPDSGEVPFALASGAHLIQAENLQSMYYREAFGRFAQGGRTEKCLHVWVEKLIHNPQLTDRREWEEALQHFRRWGKLDQGMEPYLHFMEGLYALHTSRFSLASERLESVVPAEAGAGIRSYQVIARMQGVLGEGRMPGPEQWSVLEEIGGPDEPDLELRFLAGTLLFTRFLMLHKAEQAEQRLDMMKALQQICRIPYQETAVKKAEQELRNPRSLSTGNWRAQCFGTLTLQRNGTEVRNIQWKRKKAMELFVYLLLQPGYAIPKEAVIELLFESDDPGKAQNQLYVAVHQLKQTLVSYLGEDNGVILRDGMVRLKEGLIEYVDAEQYVTLVRVGNQMWSSDRELAAELYEKASRLYGHLAADIPYTDWLEIIRRQLFEKQVEMLKRLVRYESDRGSLEQAEVYCLEWLEWAPVQEEAYQELMRVLMKAGRTADAWKWYKKLEEMCMEELGVSPMSESLKILQPGR